MSPEKPYVPKVIRVFLESLEVSPEGQVVGDWGMEKEDRLPDLRAWNCQESVFKGFLRQIPTDVFLSPEHLELC